LLTKALIDLLLVDTAGRLHTQKNLMSELKKTCNVIKKIDKDAPHEVILVLDATTGQNALKQVSTFKKEVAISGTIITKLDGTAKGGILVAIASKNPDISISFVGVGEKIDDLESFCPRNFAKSLVGIKSS